MFDPLPFIMYSNFGTVHPHILYLQQQMQRRFALQCFSLLQKRSRKHLLMYMYLWIHTCYSHKTDTILILVIFHQCLYKYCFTRKYGLGVTVTQFQRNSTILYQCISAIRVQHFSAFIILLQLSTDVIEGYSTVMIELSFSPKLPGDYELDFKLQCYDDHQKQPVSLIHSRHGGKHAILAQAILF